MKGSKSAMMFLVAVGFLLLVPAVEAGLEYLPKSSLLEGTAYYNEWTGSGFLRGEIEYAVYDTQTYPNEFVGEGGFENPGDGRYIYVYQIFSAPGSNIEEVTSFEALTKDGKPIEAPPIIATGTEDDKHGGKTATNTSPVAVWEFNNGLIYAGEHSVFLVISSDSTWTKGSFEVTTIGSEDIPAPGAPEPATVLMLMAGGVFSLLRKKR